MYLIGNIRDLHNDQLFGFNSSLTEEPLKLFSGLREPLLVITFYICRYNSVIITEKNTPYIYGHEEESYSKLKGLLLSLVTCLRGRNSYSLEEPITTSGGLLESQGNLFENG